ncbi:histidine phosphatase family protein [Herbiconiux sp. KACC 21604]|uniref:histidine phosphatase family protein n=1 Tax=unclassified Herbiconiux TaxID=2618217 RepID=UPI00149193B8|nr:histidine phosphatase family protein [Herbiconiux sp. SALV-R1]QJU54217.1 histidine phosphatase family protein [Herbiconiux sp. SALV-R1]WPO85276.1 histidine phosphatase family protein [Herbiconiux sp. KACC 21604]
MGASEIWLVRHGESEANPIATAAQRSGAETIDVEWRDADVPLSATGEEQAAAFGTWLAEHASDGVPAAIWSSPYLRARQTTELAVAVAGLRLAPRVDERLRDRELGILDRLTALGVERRYPEEAARRRHLGKFYHRPPGGESWADVALRIRSFLGDAGVDRAGDGGTLLVVAHDAVVILFLAVCTGLGEQELLDFARGNVVTNASVTRLERPDGEGLWTLAEFAAHDHLDRQGVETTEHKGDTDERAH